jgi:hypothetical protein
MNLLFRLMLAVSALFSCAAAAADVEEKSHLDTDNSLFEFAHFLRDRPLELGELLGKHYSEVVPQEIWGNLPSPEEYKNPAIKYGVYARSDLHEYMKSWKFLTDGYCVSDYSMFLMFFNRGFVFKAELRYIPDTYTGTVNSADPRFCPDETPIFTMITRILGGVINVNADHKELTRYTENYIMRVTTGTGEHNTDLSWDLRGGPSSPNF